jgi:hypothetical protein
MRIDPDTCHNSILLAAEVRRLNAVIAAGESARLSQKCDCPAQDNAAEPDKVFPQRNMTIHGAAPAATAHRNTAAGESDPVAGTGDLLTDAERDAISRDLSWLQWCEDNNQIGDVGRRDIATLRGLLERLK